MSASQHSKAPTADPLPFHPLANIFPLIDGDAFEDFVADIAEFGQREPIVIHEGGILEGRNRARACWRLGIEPRVREFGSRPGDGDDPLAFVLSANIHRRHLNESQRAMVADSMATMRQGERTDLAHDCARLSQPVAASLLHVSRRLVQLARKVRQECSPEVVSAVEHGEITIAAALPQATDSATLRRMAELEEYGCRRFLVGRVGTTQNLIAATRLEVAAHGGGILKGIDPPKPASAAVPPMRAARTWGEWADDYHAAWQAHAESLPAAQAIRFLARLERNPTGLLAVVASQERIAREIDDLFVELQQWQVEVQSLAEDGLLGARADTATLLALLDVGIDLWHALGEIFHPDISREIEEMAAALGLPGLSLHDEDNRFPSLTRHESLYLAGLGDEQIAILAPVAIASEVAS